jgi:hypothetical protein
MRFNDTPIQIGGRHDKPVHTGYVIMRFNAFPVPDGGFNRRHSIVG